MELHIYKTAEDSIKGLADFFVDKVNAAVTLNGRCSVVLSGGNSPKKLYELLASASYSNKIPWSNIFFFFGDERYVPFTDKDNNGLMAKQSLFDPLNIEDAKIFYINTSMSPDEAAAEYAKKIQLYFGKAPIRFDLVLLGLGDNAHTASLFPHTKVLYEMKKLVSAVYVEEINANRITMTAPLINESAAVAFLVYGASKAPAVFNIVEGDKNIEHYPAQLIDLSDGSVDWFLDETAAALLENKPS